MGLKFPEGASAGPKDAAGLSHYSVQLYFPCQSLVQHYPRAAAIFY